MTDSQPSEPSDAVRQAAHELVRAARSFLDAAERALDDDEMMAGWANRGQELVHSFLAGFTGTATPRDDGDEPGIEHIPVD